VAPDLHCTDHGYQPSHLKYNTIVPTAVATPWTPTTEGLPATTLEIKLESIPPDNSCALLLCIGICFGTPSGGAENVKETKYAGSARIVRVVGLGA